MELIKNFGLNPLLLSAQIVNFLVIFYLMRRYLFKPVLKVLKERKDTISEGLKAAEENKLLLEKTQAQEKEILKKAQLQAKTMIDETKAQTLQMIKDSEEHARTTTEKMIVDAKAQISKEADDTELKLMKHVSMLSIQILEKALHGMVHPKAQTEILEKAMKQLSKKAN